MPWHQFPDARTSPSLVFLPEQQSHTRREVRNLLVSSSPVARFPGHTVRSCELSVPVYTVWAHDVDSSPTDAFMCFFQDSEESFPLHTSMHFFHNPEGLLPIYTFARASFSPEGSNLLRMTMDSRWDSEDSRCSYTAFLPFCLDSGEPGQVVEKKAFLAHYVARSLPCEKPKSFTIPSTV
jgi:hypothetical protein